jgi:hypothetical protein
LNVAFPKAWGHSRLPTCPLAGRARTPMVSATLTDFWGRLAAFNQIRSRAHLPVFICLIADKILMKLM